jgi:coenzyme Q-binding protein COQ10
MPELQAHNFVPYTPEQMFAIVADIESYPQFVPYCDHVQVLARERQGEDVEIVTARMTVRYRVFSETYTSRATLDRKALAVDVMQMEGPFKSLLNTWRFQDAGGKTKIDFYLHYEFRSHGLNLVMRGFFQKMFRNFEAAFEQRARRLYA